MARSPHRFYFPGTLDPDAAPVVTLPPGESRHLLRVLRIERGATVSLFDSRGAAWLGEVEAREGDLVRIALRRRIEIAREPRNSRLLMAVSLLKRRAMDSMIEKLCELDVDSLQPLVTRRTVASPPKSEVDHAPPRWERIALAAAKQAGRNVPMTFSPVTPLNSWLRRERPRVVSCVAHGGPGTIAMGEWLNARAGMGLPVLVAVGPEGGWTSGEIKAFKDAGFTAVSLGPLVLRAETAAITVAAACRIML